MYLKGCWERGSAAELSDAIDRMTRAFEEAWVPSAASDVGDWSVIVRSARDAIRVRIPLLWRPPLSLTAPPCLSGICGAGSRAVRSSRPGA